jgi:alpha-galactosidase
LIKYRTADFPRILEILNENSFKLDTTDFWGHSDPDMLEVGNGALTFEETRTHFALWAAMKSPLLIGTDLAKLSQDNVNILKTKVLLDFSQDDMYGKPAMPYRWGTNPDYTWNATYPAEYWSGKFKQGTLVLAFNNSPNNGVAKSIRYDQIPGLSGKKAYRLSEGWYGQSWGCFGEGLDVVMNSHDTAVVVIGEECTPSVNAQSIPSFKVQ